MEKFIEELNEMNLEQVEQRLSDLEKEIRDAKAVSELEGMDEKITAVKERHAELKDLETRKQQALDLQNGAIEGKVIIVKKGRTLRMENFIK